MRCSSLLAITDCVCDIADCLYWKRLSFSRLQVSMMSLISIALRCCINCITQVTVVGSCLNESSSSAVAGLTDHSGSSGASEHMQSQQPKKKGRPAKFSPVTVGLHSGIECPVCGKLFNNSSALAKHKLTHSSERKYACDLCGKTFKRQDHLWVYSHCLGWSLVWKTWKCPGIWQLSVKREGFY